MNPAPWTAAVEAALLRAVGNAWEYENASRFGRALRRPQLRLDDSTHRLAGWVRSTREIVVSRRLVREQPWGVVVEVLKHEMAHQYAHEVLHATDETAHGPAFRLVCERHGIDAAASGLPADAARDEEAAKVLRRAQKLLALAGSPNLNEAQAAMNAAQSLLLRHNLAHLAAASTGAGTRTLGASPRPGYTWRHLGTPRARLAAADRLLGAVLIGHFFVEGVWVPVWDAASGAVGQVLEVCGSAENVEMAAYVWDFLEGSAERLWKEQVRSGGAPRGGRRAFVAGVMRGFLDTLGAQKRADAATGLVWVGDPESQRLLRRRHPHLRTVRGRGIRQTDAWNEGRAAGQELVLHKPVEGKGTGVRGLLG